MVNIMQNGFSRKTSLIVLSVILIGLILLLSYVMWKAMVLGHETLLHDAFDLLKAIALVLFGGFIALVKDLFRDDPKIAISDVQKLLESQSRGS